MFFKPKKTGINFLCDAIILPQYYNFEREAEFKIHFGNFKNITFECWNLFVAVYFTAAIQESLQQMDGCDYIKLMRKTIDYFETQYPIFRKALQSLLDYTPFDGTDEMKQGIWLAGNLLQTNKENLSIDDINMGIEIADTIKKLASVVDVKEVCC